MKDERREFRRYAVTGRNLYLYIHGYDLVEEIQDISLGGLSFEYTPIQFRELQITLIDIFWSFENPFYLSMVSCETVYDHAALPEGRTFRGRNIRRCGLKCCTISKKHKEGLESLLASNDMMAV